MTEKIFYRGLLAAVFASLLMWAQPGSLLHADPVTTAAPAAADASQNTGGASATSVLVNEVETLDPAAAAVLSKDTAAATAPSSAATAAPAAGKPVGGSGEAKSAGKQSEIARDVDLTVDVPEEVSENVGLDIRQTLSEEQLGQYLPETVSEVMQKEVFGITILQLTYSFLVLLVVLIFRNIIVRVVFVYLERFISKSDNELNRRLFDAVQKPASVFLLYFGIYLALIILPLSEGTTNLISNLYRGITVIIVFWGIVRLIDALIDVLIEQDKARFASFQGFVPLIRKTLKIFVGVVGVVMAIDNMGFNIAGILATLGIGGAALAFASKDTVANGFGTLMIMLDRPFKVGDWIIVGDKVDGDVEEIGLRSTKVRTWPKTVLSIPNGVLANEYINNWSRMPKRRVKQTIQIAYGATANDMEGLVEDIRRILREDDGVDQEFMLVNFTDLSADSLDVLVYYFTKSIKWLEHMDVRQRVNLKMMRAVEERGLTMAFLEQSVELEYNANVKDDTKMPWEERWDSESKDNPSGPYTARKNRPVGKPAPAGTSAKPAAGQDSPSASHPGDKLPGDFGPNHPL